jgi:hypothetical protein
LGADRGENADDLKRAKPAAGRPFAVELCSTSASPALQRLGHASLAVTSVYLDHIAPREVVERIKQSELASSYRHWTRDKAHFCCREAVEFTRAGVAVGTCLADIDLVASGQIGR